MREDNNTTYDALKDALDKLVRRDATLGSFGMSSDEFIEQAREEILQRVQDIASERLENNE